MDYGTIQTLNPPEFGVHGGTESATNKEAQRLTLPAMPTNESIVQGDKNPGFSDAFLASARENTLMGMIFDPFSWNDSHYNADTAFDVNKAVAGYMKFKGTNLDKDEQEFLQGAVSQEDFQNRIQRWTQKENNIKAMQASTAGTLLGAAVDPIDFLIGAGASKLKALSAIEQIGVAGATAGAISTALPSTLSDGDVLLNMVGPMIGAAMGTDKAFKLKPTVPSFTTKAEAGSKVQGVVDYFKTWQSFTDSLHGLGPQGKALADKVFGNAWEDKAMSATAFQRNFAADAQRQIKAIEQSMTKNGLFTWDPRPSVRAVYRKQREDVGIQVQQWLHASRKNEMEFGVELPLPTDPVLRDVIETYQKSGFATEMLRRAKEAGVEGAADTFGTRNYLGIVWNYDRVRDFMRRSGKSVDDVAEAFGKQITKTIGHFAGSDAKGIGMQFLKTIQGEKTGDLALKFREWELNGLSREEVVNTLRGAGVPEPEILRAIEQSFGNPNMNSVGDVTKSLRQRLDWDLSEDMGGFTLAEFLEPDIHKTMERYTLEMTSRIGLAKAGFHSGGEFQRALDEAADEAFAAGKSPEEVRRILDHARELALGRPIGDQMPDTLRSLTALGSALALKNSGIYNIGEYAALAAEYGLKRVVREFVPMLRKSSIANMTKQEAEELQDIITGRLVADGRFRPVVSYMEDNFEGAIDSIHESIQYSAQSVRFLNGSEAIRRHQVKIFAGLYQKRLEAAINGSKEARDLLLKEGLPEDVLANTARDFKRYGWNMEQWNPSTLDEISTHALSMADTSVLALRRGERPMLMDTNVGKTIFPFMSFVFAAHNKLLRRQYNRDGVLGVARIMTYQAPLAVVSAAAANVAGGKEWDADLGNGVPKAMSSLGLATIPWDLIYRGRMGGGFTGFAPINSTVELASIPDTPRGVVENIPFLSVFLPVNLMLSAFEGEEQ